LQVKEKFDNCILIFLLPPSYQELSHRLIERKTDSIETIENRLFRAREEIKLINKYDYLVINDEIKESIEKIKCIVKSESLRPSRNMDFIKKF
jgi:guanylate kinase